MSGLHQLVIFCFIAILLVSCYTQYPETCPLSKPIGWVDAAEIARDESLPFRFPLDESSIDGKLFFGWFGVSNKCPPNSTDCFNSLVRQYHTAEDYKRPAGAPVYAMADGLIRFSGRAGGYGWLIIIDHPQANLYSLYGHLSPSRWKLESGTEVRRGDLIAYLGDPDENGGSVESPLEPHLHFGVRAGQKADYPGRGDWRFQAGWIRLCPQDLGWLHPSEIITSQVIPLGGYPKPDMGLLDRWGGELLITSIYAMGGLAMIAFVVRRKLRYFLIFPAIIVIAAGIVFKNNGMVSTYTLLGIGVLILAVGLFYYFRRPTPQLLDQS